MSWQIHCIKNTVKVSKKTAAAIYKCQRYENSDEGEFFCGPEDVRDDDGFLLFNPDHGEHQDYLRDKAIVAILKRTKAKGRVAFIVIEQAADPAGDLWAHEFDGKGGYRTLIGKNSVVWMPEVGE